MRRKPIMVAATAALAVSWAVSPVRAEVIAEDEGLYEKEDWNIGQYYDDLDNPYDAPGIITRGRDPQDRSGPVLDMEWPTESSEDAEIGDQLGD